MSDTPLKDNEKLKASYDQARAKHPEFPTWEELSEAGRQQWQRMIISEIMTGPVFR